MNFNKPSLVLSALFSVLFFLYQNSLYAQSGICDCNFGSTSVNVTGNGPYTISASISGSTCSNSMVVVAGTQGSWGGGSASNSRTVASSGQYSVLFCYRDKCGNLRENFRIVLVGDAEEGGSGWTCGGSVPFISGNTEPNNNETVTYTVLFGPNETPPNYSVEWRPDCVSNNILAIGDSYSYTVGEPSCGDRKIRAIVNQDGCPFLCITCLLYTSPSPRDKRQSRMPSSA